MQLQEVFPAVQAAEVAVQLKPQWWEAWQTLGRAQLGLGEITMAVRSFQIAVHICPSDPLLWNEDLAWARQLYEQQRNAEKARNSEVKTENSTYIPETIPDYDFESEELVAVCAAIAEKQKQSETNKSTIIVAASGAIETVTEKKTSASTTTDSRFVKAR
uniref:Tetratricopeptide repeat domain 33 n=2 Tax=Latimeria chalumnae TaxID=7897 RepID=H2ZVK1_LATCH